MYERDTLYRPDSYETEQAIIAEREAWAEKSRQAHVEAVRVQVEKMIKDPAIAEDVFREYCKQMSQYAFNLEANVELDMQRARRTFHMKLQVGLKY